MHFHSLNLGDESDASSSAVDYTQYLDRFFDKDPAVVLARFGSGAGLSGTRLGKGVTIVGDCWAPRLFCLVDCECPRYI